MKDGEVGCERVVGVAGERWGKEVVSEGMEGG